MVFEPAAPEMDLRLTREDPAYPEPLRELAKPPDPLFVRGALRLDSPRVGIVGSRRASEAGRRLARGWAAELAAHGVVVVSGGALGIDAQAHEGALAAGGRTWVVLPTPLLDPSPRTHLRLFDRVLAGGGCWCTELDRREGRWAFVQRNRIVAALAEVLVVIEASARSGTRSTVRTALRLGRPVFATPWAVGDPRGDGALGVFRAGGRPVGSAADILRHLSIRPRTSEERGDSPLSDPVERRIEARLRRGPASIDALSSALALSPPVIMGVLTRLEIDRRVVDRGGRFAWVR